MSAFFLELATGATYGEGCPDWDDPETSAGRIQGIDPDSRVGRLPVGPVPFLVNGRLRFIQVGGVRFRELPILAAWRTAEDVATGHVHIAVAGTAALPDGCDVALVWASFDE